MWLEKRPWLFHDDWVNTRGFLATQSTLALPAIGAACVAAGLALPFVSVGRSERSAYSLVRSARNLNLLAGPLRLFLGGAIVFVPMFAAALLVCLALGHRKVAGALSVGIGVLGIAAALSTFLIPNSRVLNLGPILTLSGGILLMSCAVLRGLPASAAR